VENIDILLIEDNRNDAELILESLEGLDHGVRVLAINDGAEAVDYIFGAVNSSEKRRGRLPKLILLDLKLPKVGGLEILKLIKSDERTMHIPVAIFTSSGESQDRKESYTRGANSYIVKPLDADMFSRYVNDIGAYWLSMNATAYDARLLTPRH